MRFLQYCFLMMGLMLLLIPGCGGGGGGSSPLPPPTTKTVTLTLSTQGNVGDMMGGYDLQLTLPTVASLSTDTSGTPLSNAVFSSGQFVGADILPGSSYIGASHQLKVFYGSTNSYALGEFITIVMTVPVSYVPNNSDILNISFLAHAPISGNDMPWITAIIKSFN